MLYFILCMFFSGKHNRSLCWTSEIIQNSLRFLEEIPAGAEHENNKERIQNEEFNRYEI